MQHDQSLRTVLESIHEFRSIFDDKLDGLEHADVVEAIFDQVHGLFDQALDDMGIVLAVDVGDLETEAFGEELLEVVLNVAVCVLNRGKSL